MVSHFTFAGDLRLKLLLLSFLLWFRKKILFPWKMKLALFKPFIVFHCDQDISLSNLLKIKRVNMKVISYTAYRRIINLNGPYHCVSRRLTHCIKHDSWFHSSPIFMDGWKDEWTLSKVIINWFLFHKATTSSVDNISERRSWTTARALGEFGAPS